VPLTDNRVDLDNTGLHEPFLERAADKDSKDSGSNGLAAFLTMRLVDQFAADREDVSREAVRYQIAATRKFLDDLYPRNPEVTSLREIVRVAGAAIDVRDRRLLFAPLMAFAFWLEQELRLEEALDVLDSALNLSDGRSAEEEVAGLLQKARVLRLSGKFDDARAAYQKAGKLAANVGDKRSVLLSQIGRGVVMQKLGNLPESERILCEVVAAAQRVEDRDAEGRACHDLAGTLYFAGRMAQAANYAFRAYELLEQPLQRLRALSDTGVCLKELGHYSEAGKAFAVVLASHPTEEIRVHTAVELVDLSASTGDRIGFERWRRELEDGYNQLPPEDQVDFDTKVGAGLFHFDMQTQAEKHLERGLSLAEKCRMGERIFRLEELLRAVREHSARPFADTESHTVQPTTDPQLHSTLESLNSLAVTEMAQV
jgi:tetratricopeptide (TPR) repeat protein